MHGSLYVKFHYSYWPKNFEGYTIWNNIIIEMGLPVLNYYIALSRDRPQNAYL